MRAHSRSIFCKQVLRTSIFLAYLTVGGAQDYNPANLLTSQLQQASSQAVEDAGGTITTSAPKSSKTTSSVANLTANLTSHATATSTSLSANMTKISWSTLIPFVGILAILCCAGGIALLIFIRARENSSSDRAYKKIQEHNDAYSSRRYGKEGSSSTGVSEKRSDRSSATPSKRTPSSRTKS
ncbi:hypothetical protein T439DRAFT_203651 [Meredithblackwellia eburnea MCA 4105]